MNSSRKSASIKATVSLTVGILLLLSLQVGNSGHPRLERTMGQGAVPAFEHVTIDASGPSQMWAKTVGDFNNDGLDDLWVAGLEGAHWYQNPTWQKHFVTSYDQSLHGAASADIDGDGDIDIVTGSWYNRTVVWLENPGNTQQEWSVHLVSNQVANDAVYTLDLDGDGDTDIVGRSSQTWGGEQGTRVHIWRQDALNMWTDFSTYVGDGEHFNIGDVDNDGDVDFVVANRWYENAGFIANEWQEHTFTGAWTHLSAFPFVADINGDGRSDIVLTPTEKAGETYRTAWYEAPEDAKSSNWIEHVIEDNIEAITHSLQVADIDGDGDMDVMTAEMHQSNDPDEVRVYLNEDGFGFDWSKIVVDTIGSHYAHLFDVDLDGDLDIFGANHGGTNQVDLWVNHLTQPCRPDLDSWKRHVIDPAKPWRSLFIASQDIDQDGHKDIVTGGWWYRNPGTPSGAWKRNTVGSPLNNMAALADFDGDGDMDVLGTPWKNDGAHPEFVLARNAGDGTFSIVEDVVPSGEGDFLQGVAVARFEYGGSLEVALSWHNGTGNGVQMLSVPSNPFANVWSWRRISDQDQQEDLSVGDIDGDDDIDLLLGTKWLRNDSDSWALQNLSNTNEQPDRNRLVDINRDGRLDAVVGFLGISQPAKLVWYEQGASHIDIWIEHVIAEDVIGPMSLDVADMDKDGDLDVVVGEHNLADPLNARMLVYENVDGTGAVWVPHTVYIGDEHHDGAHVVDIDDDGDYDIISIGWANPRVLLYENIGSGCPSPPASYTLATNVIGSGSVSRTPDKQTYSPGETVTLQAVADSGRVFSGWSGDASGSENPLTVTMDGDKSITATFVGGQPTTYGLNVAISGSGAVVRNPDKVAYDAGETVTLTASRDPGWVFTGWSGDGSGSTNPLVMTMDSDKAIAATFVAEQSARYSLFLPTISLWPTNESTAPADTPADRVTDGLIVLYSFDGGAGSLVTDISGIAPSLDLEIEDMEAVRWIENGLTIQAATIVSSRSSAAKLVEACQVSGEVTIEAWVRPENVTQRGPARIVTLSEDTRARNFSLEQGMWGEWSSTIYDVRLRTTATSDDGTILSSPSGVANTQISHLVYSRDVMGVVNFYVDGAVMASGTITGNFSNWDVDFHLGLANELSMDRPWLGELYLVAIYCNALAEEEVRQNFCAGLPAVFTDSERRGLPCESPRGK